MNRPTDEQIRQEVEMLKEIKPKVRRHTLFGDDNHAAIDAQIAVLDGGLDEDAIYDEYGENDRLLDCALDARRWLDGEWDADDHEADSPAEDWKELIV